MSKKVDQWQQRLDTMETEVNRLFNVSQQELDRAYAEYDQISAKFNKQQDKMFKIFQDPEMERQADLELERIAREMGVDINTESRSSSRVSISDADVEKEYQQLLQEVEQEERDKQSGRKSLESGLSIEERVRSRGASISALLESHGDLAEEFARTSSDPQEKTQLIDFSMNARKLSSVIGNVTSLAVPNPDLSGDQTQEKQQSAGKLMSGFAQAAEKLYSRLKSGFSAAIDKIKELGGKLIDGIKSWFSKTPKAQEVTVTQAINETQQKL